jgi:hypothetical protein
MPPAAYKEELEFGDVVVNAIAAENTGRDWHREDAIIVRAVKASPGVSFAEFLLLPTTSVTG